MDGRRISLFTVFSTNNQFNKHKIHKLSIMKSINKTTLFLILTFVISYSLVVAFKLFGFDASNRLAFTILGATYMFIPAICVVIVKKIILKENLKSDLFISFKINKWFFVAWLIMPIISSCNSWCCIGLLCNCC